MPRRFLLYNSNGEVFDFQRSDALLISPEGLGFNATEEVARSGEFYIQTNEYMSQQKINATIAFKTYEAYTEFAAFIRHIPLKLAYAPRDEWFYRDITVASLGKTEIENEGTRLYSPIEFSCYAGWYRSVYEQAVPARYIDSDAPKSYDAETGGYTYNYTYSGYISGGVTVNANSDGVPLKITFFGRCVNPEYIVYNKGQRVARGKFNMIVADGEKLVIDANPATMTASVYSTDTNTYLRSAYNQGDRSTERFIYLPLGENRIVISSDNSTDIRADIEVKDYADAV